MKIAPLVAGLLLTSGLHGCVANVPNLNLQPVRTFPLGQREADRVQFGPDGNKIFVAISNRLQVVDWKAGRDHSSLLVPGYAHQIAVSADGNLAAIGTKSGATVVDLVANKVRATFSVGKYDSVHGVTTPKEGRPQVMLTHEYGRLIEWNCETGKDRELFRLSDSKLLPPGADTKTAWGFATHDSKRVAVSLSSGVLIYDLAARQELRFVRLPENISSNSLTFSPDGKFLAAEQGGRVCVLDAATGSVKWSARIDAGVMSLAFAPDGKNLYAGVCDAVNFPTGVVLLDPATGANLGYFQTHPETAPALAVSPDGKHLATAGADGLKVWSVADVRKSLGLGDD